MADDDRTLPHDRFRGLTYEDFRRLAADESLSTNERVGFPDELREGATAAILDDVIGKLRAISGEPTTVVDIGPGCSELADALRDHCLDAGHRVVLIDSPEMLAHHPDRDGVRKIPARFPDCPAALEELHGTAGAVIAYSVLQYAFFDSSPFAFVDAALSLLAPGGRLLLGDIPNAAMRRRFLASDTGARFHRAYTGSDDRPSVTFNTIDAGEPDDGALLGLLARARAGGFHAWLVPQSPELPMANRREDILVERP